jgi:hypothetical protein
MQKLRSIFRWYFGLLAFVSLEMAWYQLHSPDNIMSAYGMGQSHFLLEFFVAYTVLPAMTWWTTRKPTGSRNGWAIISCLMLLWPTYFYTRDEGFFSLRGPTLVLAAINLAGIIIFSIRTAPSPVKAIAKPSIAGDRTSRYANKIVTLVAVAATVAGMRLWEHWSLTQDLPWSPGLLQPLIWIVLATIVSTLLHECGHAVVGWIFDMKLVSFNAGPFQWHFHQSRWKFKFNPAGILNLGGAVNVVPVRQNPPRWHEIAMIAAGPFTNIATGLLALWAALNASGHFYEPAWNFLALYSNISIVVALVNLLPFRTGNHYSDGARILQLLTNSPLLDVFHAMNQVLSTLVSPARPRDFDVDRLRRASLIVPGGLQGVLLHLWAMDYFVDRGQLAEAHETLCAAMTVCVSSSVDLPVGVNAVLVGYIALLDRNASVARAWWDRVEKKKPKLDFNYWFGLAGVLWLEGRLDEANEAWRKAEAEVHDRPRFGVNEYDRSLCTLLRHELDQTPTADVQRPIIPLVLADLSVDMPLQNSFELA